MTRATQPTLPEGETRPGCDVCGAIAYRPAGSLGFALQHQPACDAIAELRERVRKLEERYSGELANARDQLRRAEEELGQMRGRT